MLDSCRQVSPADAIEMVYLGIMKDLHFGFWCLVKVQADFLVQLDIACLIPASTADTIEMLYSRTCKDWRSGFWYLVKVEATLLVQLDIAYWLPASTSRCYRNDVLRDLERLAFRVLVPCKRSGNVNGLVVACGQLSFGHPVPGNMAPKAAKEWLNSKMGPSFQERGIRVPLEEPHRNIQLLTWGYAWFMLWCLLGKATVCTRILQLRMFSFDEEYSGWRGSDHERQAELREDIESGRYGMNIFRDPQFSCQMSKVFCFDYQTATVPAGSRYRLIHLCPAERLLKATDGKAMLDPSGRILIGDGFQTLSVLANMKTERLD